jgi:hypothetical protein
MRFSTSVHRETSISESCIDQFYRDVYLHVMYPAREETDLSGICSDADEELREE